MDYLLPRLNCAIRGFTSTWPISFSGNYAPLAKPAICSTHRKSYAQAAPIFIAGGGQPVMPISFRTIINPPLAIPLTPVYNGYERCVLRAPVETICLPAERNLMSDTLHTVLDGRLLRLTLNRPQKRNALDLELCRALVAALEAAEQDPKVGAILLNANGKSFCAGMDLHESAVHEIGHDDGALGMLHERLFTIGSRLSKPLIAAVHGAALAGGTGLVANCHIVIASEDATFGLTEIRLGLWPFLVFRAVAAAVGERRTVELSLTGRVFGAAEARELGLLHQVAPGSAGDLVAGALEVASALAESSPTAVQSGLRSVQLARGKDWKQAGEISQRLRREVFASPDFQEGVRAFREKRQPRWPSIHDPPAENGG
jgi:enoyl-CoA hydratase/carnithine racemase